MELLTPPHYRDLSGPLVFLAGPIQGAPNWQTDAAALLLPRVHVANPKQPDMGQADFGPERYRQQVEWEHHHLEKAGRQGVILFWLAKEIEHRCDRAYAQTTRFELGEAVTLHRWQGIKVVVGLEAGFSNARYLRQTIATKAPGIPLGSTLPETCAAALALLSPGH
jgi:hypothetical protein